MFILLDMLFKKVGDSFLEVSQKEFKDLEDMLENWIEGNPELLSSPEQNLLVISRQPSTDFGRFPDLIAVDSNGNVVVIELKGGKSPRDVIAQALEYTVWISRLGYNELTELALEYFKKSELNFNSIKDSFEERFGAELESINEDQRIIIVAQKITEDVKDIANYLKGKGLKVDCAEFTYLKSNKEVYLNVEIVTREEIGSTTKTFKRISKQWDERSFFEETGKRNDEKTANTIREIYDFIKDKVDEIYFGRGEIIASFTPKFDFNDRKVSLFYVYSDGKIGLPLQVLQHNDVDTKLRGELIGNLKAIEGFVLNEEDKSPNVDITILNERSKLDRFKEIITDFLEKTKTEK